MLDWKGLRHRQPIHSIPVLPRGYKENPGIPVVVHEEACG